MATLRRILKYTPGAILGLLVVVWLASLLSLVGIAVQVPSVFAVGLSCREPGCIYLYFDTFGSYPNFRHLTVFWGPPLEPLTIQTALGRYWISTDFVDEKQFSGFLLSCPIAWLLTVQLPLAIGPFISFRFRLWHYLAYMAFVAVELAYFLHWQE